MTFLEDSIVLNCYSDDGFEIQALIPMLVEIGKHTLKKCNIYTGEASIFITNDENLRDLNRKYRGLDEVTDVLSFSNDHEGEYYGSEDDRRVGFSSEEFIIPPGFADQIGEIVISLPQVERQALANDVEMSNELKLLVVHGFLHLLGYDHMEQEEKEEMESLEKEIMAW